MRDPRSILEYRPLSGHRIQGKTVPDTALVSSVVSEWSTGVWRFAGIKRVDLATAPHLKAIAP